MNPDRATAGFRAVDHEVVGHGPAGGRIALQEIEVGGPRSRKRMMHRRPATALGVAGEHREIDHPRKVHRLGIVEAKLRPEPLPQHVERLARDVERVGHDQGEVARLAAERGLEPIGDRREIFGDRARPRAVGLHLQPHEPLRAPLDRHGGEFVEILA